MVINSETPLRGFNWISSVLHQWLIACHYYYYFCPRRSPHPARLSRIIMMIVATETETETALSSVLLISVADDVVVVVGTM